MTDPITPEMLAGVDLFAGAAPGDLAGLAARLSRRSYPAGATVFAEGDSGDSFVVLLDGHAAVTRRDGSPHTLADVAPGSVLGELSALTGEPRRATVRATSDLVVAVGDASAFAAMLETEGVRQRLSQLAARRLAALARPVPVALDDGTELLVRPLLARDRPGFAAVLRDQPIEWIHSRFFSAVTPSPALIEYLADVDFLGHFAWVVGREDPLEGAAVARYIRSATEPTLAEVAFEVADPWRGRGLGSLLLGALGAAAQPGGVAHFHAEVLRENRPMRAVLGKAGAHWRTIEPGVVETTVRAEDAAALLAPGLQSELAAVAAGIVGGAALVLGRPRGG